MKMPKSLKANADEREVLAAYEKGALKSVATRTELAKMKEAARATAIKDRRINIRLSSSDLSDIQVKALQQGIPYQTLITSVLHQYVSGSLTQRSTPVRKRTSVRASKRRSSAAR